MSLKCRAALCPFLIFVFSSEQNGITTTTGGAIAAVLGTRTCLVECNLGLVRTGAAGEQAAEVEVEMAVKRHAAATAAAYDEAVTLAVKNARSSVSLFQRAPRVCSDSACDCECLAALQTRGRPTGDVHWQLS